MCRWLSHLVNLKIHSSIYSLNIHVCIIPETFTHLYLSISLKVRCLLFLSCCIAITGYQISSNNSNSQQQPTASYRQTSKSLPGKSRPTGVKITANRIHPWQFKYVNTMTVVLCMSNELICGYINMNHFCL